MPLFLTSNYSHHLLNLIRSSKSSIDILCYIFNCNLYKKSDNATLIYLELKKFLCPQKKVRIILDLPKLHKPNYHPNMFFTRRFNEAGFDVRYLHSCTTQHAKLLIFDNKIAVTGSHNLTSRSVVSENDISLLIDDPPLVKSLIDYFSGIWENSIEA